MKVLEAPVRSERKLTVGTSLMMAAFIPALLIIGGLMISTMSMAFAVAMSGVGLAVFVGGAIYANWKVALLIFAICAAILPVLYVLVYHWLPVWLPSVGINF